MPAARARWTRCGCAPGSLLQPRFPAPLGMRGLTMMRVLAALNGLINVAGKGAPAAHSAYVIIMMRGTADGQPFLLADGIGVGYGARPDRGRHRCGVFRGAGELPGRVPGGRLPRAPAPLWHRSDSGGPGRLRGGCGIVREYEMLADEPCWPCASTAWHNPPWGAAGGMGGGSGRAR